MLGRGVILLGGVLTLALFRVLFGGVAVLVSALFGVGAVILWVYDAYSSTFAPTGD